MLNHDANCLPDDRACELWREAQADVPAKIPYQAPVQAQSKAVAASSATATMVMSDAYRGHTVTG
jgi:hypothetical protein